jgi:hypothetical protein
MPISDYANAHFFAHRNRVTRRDFEACSQLRLQTRGRDSATINIDAMARGMPHLGA